MVLWCDQQRFQKRCFHFCLFVYLIIRLKVPYAGNSLGHVWIVKLRWYYDHIYSLLILWNSSGILPLFHQNSGGISLKFCRNYFDKIGHYFSEISLIICLNYSDKFGHNNGGIFWNFAEIMIFQWNCGNISVILHKNLLVLWPNFTVFFLWNSIGISVEFWWNLGEISSTFSPGTYKQIALFQDQVVQNKGCPYLNKMLNFQTCYT